MTGTPTLSSIDPRAPMGLSSAEAARRLSSDGPNLLPPPRRPHPLLQLAAQMVHAFAVMLWVAAVLALVVGMPTLSIAIVAVIVINGIFAFVQEYRADRAAERLGGMMPAKAMVRRDGRATLVDAAELVVGDVVVLEAGDRVPADAAVLLDATLGIDASLLTGESRAVRPDSGDTVYAGSFVVLGHGRVVVTATGTRTRLAGVDRATRAAAPPRSPLDVQLRRVVRTIGLIAVVVGVAFCGISLLLGRGLQDGLLLAIGVCVALVPEGLLPTVTLSLARAAQQMARRHALVRRLESVETLGATTFICTDKTGTLTQNAMVVVRVWTPLGWVDVDGAGYAPDATVRGGAAARSIALAALDSAARCSPDSRATLEKDRWIAVGDPMEVAIHVGLDRLGGSTPPAAFRLTPFDPVRRCASAVDADGGHVVGAPDVVLAACGSGDLVGAADAVRILTGQGLRVLAVSREAAGTDGVGPELLAVLALQDPPRLDVADAIARCRIAGIKIAMVTGDHPGTAGAVASEVGLLGPAGIVLSADELPEDDAALAAILEQDGVVVARVEPADKLRIARALQKAGHVVAMTGDGVNDGPALRQADIGVAMGASGTDVARQAADIVLLDDHFGTIVAAVELGRATFANIRRFLTYHLTDNVAELAPFVAWALSGGHIPLGLTVLQILALDIGTDLLPALALGGEPADRRTMSGPAGSRSLIDRRVVFRAFGVLGPSEALASLGTYLAVLALGGWSFGATASPALLAVASGSLFASIVLAQLANAFACRSETRWVGAVGFTGNRLLQIAVVTEVALLFVFLLVPPLPALLGAAVPGPVGWALALLAVPVLWAADAGQKRFLPSRRPSVGRSRSEGRRKGRTRMSPDSTRAVVDLPATAPRWLRAIALDLDGTIAFHDVVAPETLDAIAGVRAAGVRAFLVTGRRLADLDEKFAGLESCFDGVVAENGCVLAIGGHRRLLADPVRPDLVSAVRQDGVQVVTGDVLVATGGEHAARILEIMTRLGMDVTLLHNRGELMVLPAGVSKGTGLLTALQSFRLNPHNALAVGDAENDHAMFDLVELGVATPDAVPALRARADLVLRGDNGAAVAELFRSRVLGAEDPVRPGRREIVIGSFADGAPATLPANPATVVVVGGSGRGKSYLTGVIAERLAERNYGVLVVDPEGEQSGLSSLPGIRVVVAENIGAVRQAVDDLETGAGVVFDMASSSVDQRHLLQQQLAAAVADLRARTGLPHWILADEAHLSFGPDGDLKSLFDPQAGGHVLVSYRPEQLSPEVLAETDVVISATPPVDQLIGGAASAANAHTPAVNGHALMLRTDTTAPPMPFVVAGRVTPHQRHRRKYVEALVAPGRGFRFRMNNGDHLPEARSLQEFRSQLTQVPPDVLAWHLERGDVSSWLAGVIQDRSLARKVAALEHTLLASRKRDALSGRQQMLSLVDARYFS